ncbi:MAG: sugar ABC transporter permease [Clostridiales bacterium]|nr:sugar ABC transporter permease [Clostridiales bacterium]
MEVTKLKRKRVRDVGELIFYICLVALPLLQVAIFYIYVNLNSFAMSFQTYDTISGKFTWDFGANFSRFWQELTKSSLLWDAFVNSLIIWVLSAIFGRILAILFSYYIYKKWILDKFFKFFLFLPSILPGILLVIVFKFFANEAIPGYLLELHEKVIDPLLIGSKTLMPTIYFFNIWVSFGGQILIYTGAMDQVAPEIIEAGKVDGVKPYQELFLIIVPMILPTVTTFMVASVATLFTNQASLYSFFGDNVGYENFTIGYYLFELVNKTGNGKSMYTYASALGIVCTLIAFPLTLLVRRLLEGKEER